MGPLWARLLAPPRPATTTLPGPRPAECGGAPAGGAAASAPGDMYLLDGSGEPASPPGDAMPRGTPPRKTVYRISVTMVRKEQLAVPGPRGSALRPVRRLRPARSPDAPGRLVEEEAEEAAGAEDPEGSRPRAWDFRTFRTRSTGQLELGRFRPCARGPRPMDLAGSSSAAEQEPSLPVPGSPDVEGSRPAPLRRSLSFRHWSGSEVPRDRALGQGRRHSSSGNLAWALGGEAAADPEAVPESAAATQPASEKRNTLDVGEVLSKNDALSDLERWERSKSKNRTLDNSDLQRLERTRAAAVGSGAASEHRLLRFFSGIFARRDTALGGGPSPRSGPSRPRGYFSLRRAPTDAQSSSAESIDGSPRRGGQRGRGGRAAVGTGPAVQRAGTGEQRGRLPSRVTSGQVALLDVNSGTAAPLRNTAAIWMLFTAPAPSCAWWHLSGCVTSATVSLSGEKSPCRVAAFSRPCWRSLLRQQPCKLAAASRPGTQGCSGEPGFGPWSCYAGGGGLAGRRGLHLHPPC